VLRAERMRDARCEAGLGSPTLQLDGEQELGARDPAAQLEPRQRFRAPSKVESKVDGGGKMDEEGLPMMCAVWHARFARRRVVRRGL